MSNVKYTCASCWNCTLVDPALMPGGPPYICDANSGNLPWHSRPACDKFRLKTYSTSNLDVLIALAHEHKAKIIIAVIVIIMVAILS